MRLAELVSYLDDYLGVCGAPDFPGAHNGLQVAGTRDVIRVALAVDACLATIDAAVRSSADVLVVHHGLFWGSTAPVTGTYYARLAALIRSGTALYSCHLPLDAHEEVGNNHVLARLLGLHVGGRFGEFQGTPIGVWADTDEARDDIMARVEAELGGSPLLIATGPERVRRIGIASGGAGSWVDRAHAAGCDTLLTGEGEHHTFFAAEELGMNVVHAGHYATETVGVRALGRHLAERLGLHTEFLDRPTGL